MKKITTQTLDELARTMTIIRNDESQDYVGRKNYQCFIDSMVDATRTVTGTFNSLSCGISGSEETISLGGYTFNIRISNYGSSHHPNVNAYYSSGGEYISGNTINGEQSYRYKFGNATASDIFGTWIVIPESAISVFESYFGLK